MQVELRGGKGPNSGWYHPVCHGNSVGKTTADVHLPLPLHPPEQAPLSRWAITAVRCTWVCGRGVQRIIVVSFILSIKALGYIWTVTYNSESGTQCTNLLIGEGEGAPL